MCHVILLGNFVRKKGRTAGDEEGVHCGSITPGNLVMVVQRAD